MNAILSICHFCELHGPSVVFCTQAFRDLLRFNTLSDLETSESENNRGVQDEKHTENEKSELWKYGRIHQDIKPHARNESPNDTCVACRSFPHTKPGYISNDDSAQVSYISSQYPLQPELYILLRQACIRSLSCEVCPGKEGPIYFGDEARGHVLSYTFFLRDVQARGFQRWYSIMVLMKDKMLLLNSWPFVVKHLKQIIGSLQESASKIYENEESKVSHRSLRSAAVMMDNSRKQRVAGQPRSLCEMVGEEGVWQYLHCSFTWILKASGLRLQERLVEGPSISTFMADCPDKYGGLNIQDSYNVLGETVFHHLVHHLLIGRQVIFRGNSDDMISSLVKSMQCLLPKHCYKAIQFSHQYVDCASCNVLGLHTLANIPENVITTKNLYIVDLIPIEADETLKATLSTTSPNSFQSTWMLMAADHQSTNSVRDIKDGIKKYIVKVTQKGPLPSRPPQILGRIESAVTNATLSYSTLCVYLSTILYEWINKVKVWVHIKNTKKLLLDATEKISSNTFLQAGNSSSIPIIHNQSYSFSSSPVMSSFRSISPGGLVERQDVSLHDDRHQLLTAIGSTEWDVPLLEFWAKNFCQDKAHEVALQ